MTLEKVNKTSFIFLVLIWGAYLLLTYFTPISEVSNRYNLSFFQIQALRVSIAIPLFVIWYAAVYGTVYLFHYVAIISGSEESIPIKKLALGVFVLTIGLILPSFLNFWTAYSPGNDLIARNLTILRNYISVAVSLVAFWYIYRGVYSFAVVVDTKIASKKVWALILFIIFISLYAILVFQNPYRTISDNPGILPTYYLSDTAIVLSIMVPYIVSWYFGIFSILGLNALSHSVKGIFYKKSFRYLARGFMLVVGLSMALQLLAQAGSFWSNAALSTILILVYIILAVIVGGYLYIAKGARELSKIESA